MEVKLRSGTSDLMLCVPPSVSDVVMWCSFFSVHFVVNKKTKNRTSGNLRKSCSDRVQAFIEVKLISGTGDLMLCVPRLYQILAYMQFLLFWDEKMRTKKKFTEVALLLFCLFLCEWRSLWKLHCPGRHGSKVKSGTGDLMLCVPPSVSDVGMCAVFIVLEPKDDDEEEHLLKRLCSCFACFCVNWDLCGNYTILAFKVKSGAHAVRPSRYPMSVYVQSTKR